MASFRSLGVHTPSALPYLIAESVLPEHPSESQYTWDTYSDNGPEELGEEEVVATDYCVVYSRGGIVQKVFRFEVEEQKVLQAVLTWFPSDEGSTPRDLRKEDVKEDEALNARHGPRDAFRKDAQSTVGATSEDTSGPKQYQPQSSERECQRRSRALVVFLKSQAHVYFLSGTSHVVTLPFEVEKALPAPRGLLLQRKLPTPTDPACTTVPPAAPQNSFFSQQAVSQQLPPRQSFPKSFSAAQTRSHNRISLRGSRRSQRSKAGSINSLLLKELLHETQQPSTDQLPRLFSFTDPLSEMGLVVCKPSGSRPNSSQSTYDLTAADLQPVRKEESLLYVSSGNEVPPGYEPGDRPLYLVVTANHETGMYNVWYASYIETRPASLAPQGRSTVASGAKSRRTSSFVPGTGATTPGARAREGTRESLAGPTRSKTVPSSFSASTNQSKEPENARTAEDMLASQLDPDFDLSRQPVKDSRRVSSLLSRTDLSTGFDKSAFQDLATSHASFGNSFGGHARRGQSSGGQADRTSFGGEIRARIARESTSRGVARPSIGTASIDETLEDLMVTGNDELLEDYGALGESVADDSNNDLGRLALQEPVVGLKQEFVMTKFAEIPMDNHDLASTDNRDGHTEVSVELDAALASQSLPCVGSRMYPASAFQDH